MADDITLNAGTGGDTLGADDIAGVKYQIVKMGLGALDSLTLLDGNSGNKSAGTQRVVLATDQPQLTNALKVDGSAVTQPVSDGGSTLSVDDGGSSLTVDGTVAVSGTVTVDASGAAVPVTDNSGSLTVDNGGTFAVQATMAAAASSPPKAEDSASANADVGIPAMAVQKATPANTAGTDGDYEFLQMSAGRLWTSSTIDSALPAGTNAIGKLAANSGVDIGDVDVASVIPGTGATNLGKAEDAAHTTGDVGVMALSVRKDTGAATAGTDGDYQPLITDSSGNLYVNVAAGGTSGTQYTEDAASAADPTGNALIMVRADTPSATTSTDGDNIAARGTNKGELYVKHIDAIPVTDNGGNISIDDGGNSITVDGSVTVSGTVTANPASGTIDTVTTVGTVSAFGVSTTGPMKKEDVASADGDAGMAMLAVRKGTPANTSGTDGDYEFLQMSAGRLWASATIDAALPAGTNAIGKLAANSGVDIGDVDILSVTPGTGATNLGKAEDAAHSSGDVGVMALGVRAAAPTERSAGPTDGDYEPFATNEVGAMWVSPTGSANGGLSTFMASGSDGSSILVATAQAIKASAGTMYGYFAYNPESAVTFVHFYNTAAGSVTVGTTNPLFTLQIPPTSAANMSIPQGIAFSNAGWSCAATTTAGGNTAPATGVSLTVWYK